MVLMPGAPVTPQDVYDAARVILGFEQRESYIAWRDERWYSDEALPRLIADERGAAIRRRDAIRMLRGYENDVFSLPTAHDVLLAGLAMRPRAVISSLDQLGVRWDTSPAEDFAYAFDLLDRPGLFDPIRETGLPLSEAKIADKVLGEPLLRLMWRAGFEAQAILDAVYTGNLPDRKALETLVALRSPSVG